MSHSGSLAAYAFTLDCRNHRGLIIEEVRNMPDLEPIAQHYFCGAEAGQLLSFRARKRRQEAFFRCWTRKESYIRLSATGYPSARPISSDVFARSAARLVHIGHDAGAASTGLSSHLEPRRDTSARWLIAPLPARWRCIRRAGAGNSRAATR